jgi:hypothetical protein
VADRTSPVMRGKWVMEVMMGSPPPAPPADVPAFEATKGEVAGKVLTVRERMETHRANPTCMSCHRVIDPIGLSLENFDVTGKYRIKDAGAPVDTEEHAVRRHADRRLGRTSRGTAQAPGRRPPEFHREPDDLRARPPHRRDRTCGRYGASSATRKRRT